MQEQVVTERKMIKEMLEENAIRLEEFRIAREKFIKSVLDALIKDLKIEEMVEWLSKRL